MNAGLRRVGLSFGLLDRLDDGLGEFCSQLGARVAQQAVLWRERHGVVFDFHLRSAWHGRFGGDVGYVDADPTQERRHAGAHGYDLWHVLHQHNHLLPPTPGAGRRLLTVHDLNYLYTKSGISRWRYGRAMRALLARTDEVVCISEHTAADLRRHAAWRGPLTVVHNGVRDLSGHERVPIAGLGPPGRPFLFHLSRMSPSKNPRALLDLAAVWPEMTFLFCGPISPDSQALAQTNRLPNVHFKLGISDAEKAWAYAECAGFLFPSLTEGFGLPPIEAMYFGKPVFLSRLTSLPEVGGDVAHYFDRFEPHAMRAVVEAGLRDAAGAAAAVRARAAHFNWERATAAYLRLYARMLGLADGGP